MLRTEFDEDVAMVYEEAISCSARQQVIDVRYKEHCERGVELVSFEMRVSLQPSNPRKYTMFQFNLCGKYE